ncbi:MAG: SMI1/KNR4 family protein [Clostridia bacterium]|nr:SMI1/KNR4 family protein [Clostridia bacterium]
MKKTKAILEQLEKQYGAVYDEASVKLIHEFDKFGPKSYLCEMFPPLSEEELAKIDKDFKHNFPEELKELYRITNGLNFFDKSLIIGGIPPYPGARRSGKSCTPLMAISFHPTPTTPKGRLYFASRRWTYEENIAFFMDCTNTDPIKPVYACHWNQDDPFYSWPSLDDFISSEFNRYMKAYSKGEYECDDICGILKSLRFNVVDIKNSKDIFK